MGYKGTARVHTPSAQELLILHTTDSTALLRPPDPSLPSSNSYLLSCILVVVRADTHDLSAIATLLKKHLTDGDGFYLAAPLAIVWGTPVSPPAG
jgi:hypothetical protein